ncbi:MAG: glycosyltransferase family 4 protein, partial [Gemmatimonadales bacterium]
MATLADEAEGVPIRICVLAEAFAPIVGGGETHALILSEELGRLGAQVMVLTRRTTRQLPERERRGLLAILRVGPSGFKRLGKYLMGPAALAALIGGRARYGLIYVAGFRVLGIVAVLAGKLLGRPAVLRAESNGELSGEFVIQGVVARQAVLRSAARILIRARNVLLRRADVFLAITRGIEAEFLAEGVPKDRIVYIPNGVQADGFVPADPAPKQALRNRLGLPPDRVVWCYTGKLMRGKGLELLLEIWGRLVADDPRLMLVLVGGGSHHALSCEPELRDYVRAHGLDGSVRFTGYVSNVVEYLQASD